jgi:hypothetical protein
MSLRHRNALAINNGACNPVAITNTLLRAMEEIRQENTDTDAILMDPAVRLMVHQLSWLTRSGAVSFPIDDYMAATAACEKEV